jgi:hypothetical protein
MALELEIIKQQLQSCIAQRDKAAQTFQQCVGAIAVLEEQLKVMMAREMEKEKEELAAKLAVEAREAVMDCQPAQPEQLEEPQPIQPETVAE